MRYQYIKDQNKWIDNADPITKAKEEEYFEEQRKEKERHNRILEHSTRLVTNEEDVVLPSKNADRRLSLCVLYHWL